MVSVVGCDELSHKESHRQVGTDMMITLRNLGDAKVNVLFCTDLIGTKPPHRLGANRVILSGHLGGEIVTVVGCTDLSCKDRQLDVDAVVISKCLRSERVDVLVGTNLTDKEPHRQVGWVG